MSKSVPILHPNTVINQHQIIEDLSLRTGISKKAILTILQELPRYILSQFLQGNAVRINGFLTFHLRRRNYSPERRANFHMGKATLPEFCIYPHAEFSTSLRQSIADQKDTIAQSLDTP